ncbi:transposase [Myxococcus fulvus]|uniref:transposase n=1 Tax=Myxococcus fulvus TaxID=33 RepID=UPI0020BDD562|nr:transposase [Myxococcus fulvus]MCK8498421.1 transposase [Myxococcus fulvus]
MMEVKKPRRPRRSYTEEFKAGAVRLVLEEGKTTSQVSLPQFRGHPTCDEG